MFLARITVTLKPTVNDPQGLAVQGGLHTLGFTSVGRVRVGRYLEVRLGGIDRSQAEGQVREMCRRLLANPVIEEFRFELEEVSSASAHTSA